MEMSNVRCLFNARMDVKQAAEPATTDLRRLGAHRVIHLKPCYYLKTRDWKGWRWRRVTERKESPKPSFRALLQFWRSDVKD